jgi:RNA polymerase sigma-70 factor (ECF subfamily)
VATPGRAEELTQQAFIAAVGARDEFDGRADPLTWVLSIAHDKLIDDARRRAREERRRLRLLELTVPADADPAPRLGADRRHAVAETLGTLPETQRAALVLHHVEGLSVREVMASVALDGSDLRSATSDGYHAGWHPRLRPTS